jgi:group I intron endonuclease
MIINLVTEDYYIGSAATNRFYARFSNHLIYFIGSKIVKLSVKKYGLNNFLFVVLEIFPYPIDQKNNKDLLLLEDRYLKTYLPNYNILTEAGSSFGYKHTEIVRKKMQENFSDERREFIKNLNKGKKLSAEVIEKIRKAA